MDLEYVNRRDLLQWLLWTGALLGETAPGGAKPSAHTAEPYPSDKVLRPLAREGWVVNYTKTDQRREGIGLRAPSIIPPEKYVITPAIIESQFQGRGLCNVLMPSFAHICNQTCLASRVEVEANDKLLRRGTDYTIKQVVTRPFGNRFWQASGIVMKKKGPVKIRIIGMVANAPAPGNLEAAKKKITEAAGEANRFEKKYKIAPMAHWLKKPSSAVNDAAAEVRGEKKKDRFAAYLRILQEARKKCKLDLKGRKRDPEVFVKDGMKGSCGANADFVNFTASSAGFPYLYYTEGFIVFPRLNYWGLHAWNTACCNGWFIADSLNPDLFFPEYANYVATSIGPNIGHPGGVNGTTNGGLGRTNDTLIDYYIYFSQPGYGINGEKLNKMEIPEGIKALGDFVAKQRTRVNKL